MRYSIAEKWPYLAVCLLAIGLNAGIASAEMTYPILCCPDTCRTVDRSNAFISVGDGTDRRGVRRGASVIPLADNVFMGQAPDNQVHACVGFDAFGDEEIKCLFTPPLM
ncbi:MAG: hypothetical protein JJ992_08625 [Planctomycetes bacterium]|nr:hypothetical protein [Planctomycetota bacterium]